MKTNFFIVLVFICSLIESCKKNKVEVTVTRDFYMGVTPWPGDFTVNEVDTAYQFINNHCDIVSHHFDDGIPYEEAYNLQPMPAALVQDITYRKSRTGGDKKILLSIAALNLTRIAKADYYAQSTVTTAIKNAWKALPVNDAKVVTAYINYVSWLVDNFHPTYINFGVESNASTFSTTTFTQYKQFLAQVYLALKNKYPTIPLFISFIVDETAQGFTYANELLPYTDYIALSAYPYVTVSSSAGGNTNPALFPANYFEKFITMSNKPVAIAETSYIAEDLNITSFNLHKQGNETWQRDYLEKICALGNQYHFKFIIWFCSKDYDAASATLIATGQYQDLFGLWQDTGLKNENGKNRLAYTSWINWFAKQKLN